jgi:hypothetical protein
MTLGIITCLYGDYDTLFPLPKGHGFDEAVCVTDNLSLEAQGWKMKYFPPVHSSLSISSKFPRCFPELFLHTDSSVWIDASFRVRDLGEDIWYGTQLTFKEWALHYLERGDIVLLPHPEYRTCAFQEAEFGKRLMWKDKYKDEPLDEQVESYKAAGMPPEWGLWGVGYMARHHSPKTHAIGLGWWKEILKWGAMCQVSLPYVLWKNNHEVVEWEVFNEGKVFRMADDGITPLIKFHPFLEGYQHISELTED